MLYSFSVGIDFSWRVKSVPVLKGLKKWSDPWVKKYLFWTPPRMHPRSTWRHFHGRVCWGHFVLTTLTGRVYSWHWYRQHDGRMHGKYCLKSVSSTCRPRMWQSLLEYCLWLQGLRVYTLPARTHAYVPWLSKAYTFNGRGHGNRRHEHW